MTENETAASGCTREAARETRPNAAKHTPGTPPRNTTGRPRDPHPLSRVERQQRAASSRLRADVGQRLDAPNDCEADRVSGPCACGFGSLIEEADRSAAAWSESDRAAQPSLIERLGFDAALFLVRGASASGRRLGAAYLLRLEGTP